MKYMKIYEICRYLNDQVMSTAHAFIVPALIGCQVDPKTKQGNNRGSTMYPQQVWPEAQSKVKQRPTERGVDQKLEPDVPPSHGE